MVFIAPSRAELKSKDPTLGLPAYLLDGGDFGLFMPLSGLPNIADPREAVFVISDVPGYYWKRMYTGPVNFSWFRPNPIYSPSTDNSAALNAAVAMIGVTGEVLYLPDERYGFTQPVWIDATPFKTTGIRIVGAGRARTTLDFRSCTVSPNFTYYCNDNAGPRDIFYPVFEDFDIVGQIAGRVFQLGQDDFSDPVNMPALNRMTIQNFCPEQSSRAAVLNYVCGGHFDWQVNCGSGGYTGGNGVALTMRQVSFSRIFGSVGSAETAVLMCDGFNVGNHLDCLDMENVKICWRIISGTAWNNVATAGQWSFSHCGIDHQTGLSNEAVRPNIAPNPPVGPANFVAASAGLTVRSSGIIPVNSPPQAWLKAA